MFHIKCVTKAHLNWDPNILAGGNTELLSTLKTKDFLHFNLIYLEGRSKVTVRYDPTCALVKCVPFGLKRLY